MIPSLAHPDSGKLDENIQVYAHKPGPDKKIAQKHDPKFILPLHYSQLTRAQQDCTHNKW